MASLISVRLNKGDSPNWGFRLQGGKDFGTPLIIQKVNGGSPAEKAGLIAGDSVIKINNTDVFNLRHKDAQDVVVRSGGAFEMTIQRGGSTWKPAVVPTGSFPKASPTINNVSPVTKTSLAANKSENIGAIGTGHNVSAKPFNTQVNGAVNGGPPKLVNKQYNTPVKLYSEESIAETLSAQTEVLSTGALGVNFKKNEKNYDATNSAVFRMLQEAENEPRTPEDSYKYHLVHKVKRIINNSSTTVNVEPDSGVASNPGSGIAGLKHIQAPENKPAPPAPQLPPGQNICGDCERLIVGVFVRIKDKNLHVECFKCSTCGTSLKNVGYYNINNKLYCDIHAKLAARSNPPGPNLVPVTIPPGSNKAPASAISAALASHSIPSPSALSPQGNTFAAPYQQPENVKNSNLSSPINLREVNNNKLNNLYNNSTPLPFNRYLNKSGANFAGPKPFSSVSAPLSPLSTLPRTASAPLSPVVPPPAPAPVLAPAQPPFSPASSAGRFASVKPGAGRKGRSAYNIIWPPLQEEPDLPTASPLYFPPPSQVQAAFLSKKIESDSGSEYDYYTRIDHEPVFDKEMMSYQYQPKMSVCSEEITNITGRRSAIECIETISESLQTQKLVENIMKTRPKSPPPINVDIQSSNQCFSQSSQSIASCATTDICCQRRESCDLKRPTDFNPSINESKTKTKFVENTVPQQWESPMVQALRTVPSTESFKEIPTKYSHSALASALAIAPAEPFNPLPPFNLKPVPLPEETVPYFPPERPIIIEPKEPKPPKPDSQFVSALKIAPERPFTPSGVPVKKKKDPNDQFFQDLPKPQEKLSMLTALTTAPDRPYSPLIVESVKLAENTSIQAQPKINRSNLERPMKPVVLPTSFQQNRNDPKPPGYYPQCLKKSEESTTEEKSKDEKSDTTLTKVIKTQEIIPGQSEMILTENQTAPCNFPPIFHGFSCSFQNKTDHSQFSVDICTTPPILTQSKSQTSVIHPTAQVIKSETVTEEKQSRQQSSSFSKQERKQVETIEPHKSIAKQSEEVIVKKPLPLSSALHKPQGLPQYQVNLSESAEADLQLMKKMEAAQLRMEQKKVAQTNLVQKPVVTVHPDGPKLIAPQMSFQPVISDNRPPSSTFSPRPRSLTPSMINKPPPTLPYYQANLVAQQYHAPSINLLDPASPAVSRSPSPCPERRSPSPFQTAAAAAAARARSKSPAAGPPPNPLKSSIPLPTPRDSKVQTAKKNLSTFIPEYKSKRDLIERVQGVDFNKRGEEIYNSQVQTGMEMQNYQLQNLQIEEERRAQLSASQTSVGSVSTRISEQSHREHLDQKYQSQSMERSSDGFMEVQRKRTVIEEFEHNQKQQQIEIEKNVCTTRKYPFREVNAPDIVSPNIGGMHITNPRGFSGPKMNMPIVDKSCSSSSNSCKMLPNPCGFQSIVPPKPPVKHVQPPGSSKKPNQSVNTSNVPLPNIGASGGRQAGAVGVAPKRGRGILNAAAIGGARVPLCGQCHNQIRYHMLFEHVSEIDSTNTNKIVSDMKNGNLQTDYHPPPPPPIPVYSQINISIPYSSLQLDSKGSSPRSDYSSTSSTGNKNLQNMESAREKILDEIRNLTPRLRKTNLSPPQLPRMELFVRDKPKDYDDDETPNLNSQLTKMNVSPDKLPTGDKPNDYEILKLNTQLRKTNVSPPKLSRMELFVRDKPKDYNEDDTPKLKRTECVIPIADYTQFSLDRKENRNNESDNFNNTFPRNNFAKKITNYEMSKPNNHSLPSITLDANKTQTNQSETTKKTFNNAITANINDSKEQSEKPKIPVCNVCNSEITRGPFITALGKIWCPDHFVCTTPSCRRPLQDLGFVEEQGQLYCEYCFEQYLAPPCAKCNSKIKGDCLKAIGKNFHPECFNCTYCGKLFGNSPFFLEDALPYCEADWNELFTTKCFACGFPVEAGDRWVEALNNNYHTQCFNCTMCKKNLEGQSFFAKGGRPFCKNHAR